MLAQPGPVPDQAGLELVPGGEPRLLRLDGLLVQAGRHRVLRRAAGAAAGDRMIGRQLRDQLGPHPLQRGAHRRLGHAEDGGYLGFLHAQRPAHEGDRVLLIRQFPDDLPAPFQRDRGEGLAGRAGRGLRVADLDPHQLVAGCVPVAEAVHPDIGHGLTQAASALVIGQVPQLRPGPGRGFERRLDQIISYRPIPAGQRAGVTENLPGVGREAVGQLVGVVWRDTVIITHRPPPRPWPARTLSSRLDRNTGHGRKGSRRQRVSPRDSEDLPS